MAGVGNVDTGPAASRICPAVDPDSRHTGQDPGKREVIHLLLDLLGDDVALVFEVFHLRRDG